MQIDNPPIFERCMQPPTLVMNTALQVNRDSSSNRLHYRIGRGERYDYPSVSSGTYARRHTALKGGCRRALQLIRDDAGAAYGLGNPGVRQNQKAREYWSNQGRLGASAQGLHIKS